MHRKDDFADKQCPFCQEERLPGPDTPSEPYHADENLTFEFNQGISNYLFFKLSVPSAGLFLHLAPTGQH